MIRSEVGQVAVYSFARLAAAGAQNFATTRLGGISGGPYTALNLGYSVGDEAAAVAANRRLLYAAVGAVEGDVVTCHQVHSTNVMSVGDGARGRGAVSATNMIPNTDALITDRPDLFLFLRFADCVPIVFCDPQHGAVGLAHAGWKGTVGDIVGVTIAAMTRAFGSRPEAMLAAVGPAVGACHYTVQDDVATQVRTKLPFWKDILTSKDDGFGLDLPEANRRLLLAAGVPEASVEMSGLCTACHTDDFYSHRAENGKTGRFGVLVSVAGRGQQT